MPPVAVSVWEYDAPTRPAGSVEGELMARGPSVIVSVNVWLTKWRAESLTLTLKVETRGVVGVPLITPSAVNARRGGRVPEPTYQR